MVSRKRILVFCVTLALAASLAVNLFFVRKSLHLEDTVAGLEKNIQKLEGREKLILKKYNQEKAKASTLLRNKLHLESTIGDLKTTVAELEQRNGSQQEAQETALAEWQKKIDNMEMKQIRIEEKNRTLQARLSDAKSEISLKDGEIQGLEARIDSLNDQQRGLEAEIRGNEQTIRRYASHNRDLIALSEELLERYETKHMGESFLQIEPFLQLKRVELEKFVQEYSLKIENEQIAQ